MSPKKPVSHEQATLQQIAEEDLQTYLISHFKKLSKVIRQINLFRKDELAKMILECKNIIVIEVSKGE